VFASQASGARFHIEHLAQDTNPVPYRHVQDLTVSELSVVVRRGLVPHFGAELVVPARTVVNRIRFEDLAHQPYVPVEPDTHHRNETLNGVGDPTLSLLAAWPRGEWTVGGRAGVSVPLGKTEPNPFALGRLGLRHEHIQFGTGTFGPLLGAGAARKLGGGALSTSVLARVPLGTNSHGYRVGARLGGNATYAHPIPAGFGGVLGLDLQREWAETWDQRIEEEGNLGRTDVLLLAGVTRVFAGVGALALEVRIPVSSHAHGEQADYPLVYSLGWSR
jgi:hypothetical protein